MHIQYLHGDEDSYNDFILRAFVCVRGCSVCAVRSGGQRACTLPARVGECVEVNQGNMTRAVSHH